MIHVQIKKSVSDTCNDLPWICINEFLLCSLLLILPQETSNNWDWAAKIKKLKVRFRQHCLLPLLSSRESFILQDVKKSNQRLFNGKIIHVWNMWKILWAPVIIYFKFWMDFDTYIMKWQYEYICMCLKYRYNSRNIIENYKTESCIVMGSP
jgi:hypothetical protein